MKKITLLFAFIGMISLQSCTVNEVRDNTVDNDTISEVYEVTRSFSSGNNFSSLVTLPHVIYSSDMVLVYRLSGVVSGTDVWKLQPETYYFPDGTLDFGYDFDFTQYDVNLFMHGFDLAGVSPNYRTNQVFRIVIVPGYFAKHAPSKDKSAYEDYEHVVATFGKPTVQKIL